MGINADGELLEYFEGKNSKPKIIFNKAGDSKLQIAILEENNHGLPVWTLQSDDPLHVSQTVYGLVAGVKYRMHIGSERFEAKVANAKGALSFSLDLKGGQKMYLKLVAEVLK